MSRGIDNFRFSNKPTHRYLPRTGTEGVYLGMLPEAPLHAQNV